MGQEATMKRLCVGSKKATMTDDRGVTFTVIKDGNLWIFEGIAYENPFKAFMGLEKRLNRMKTV